MSLKGFEAWFKAQYEGLPDPERERKLEREAWVHVNELSRIGKEREELKRLSVAWTDCLYAWQARGSE